jgi:hypothetical protein
MEPAAAPLVSIVQLNTDLLLNSLADLFQDEAEAQLPGGGNSLIFLAAELDRLTFVRPSPPTRNVRFIDGERISCGIGRPFGPAASL